MKLKIFQTILMGAIISIFIMPVFVVSAKNPTLALGSDGTPNPATGYKSPGTPTESDLLNYNIKNEKNPNIPDDSQGLIIIIKAIFKWIQYALFIVSSIFIVIGAFDYVTAKGDPDKVKNGQNILIFALVGLVLAIIAGGVPNIVASLLNVDLAK